jgi:hypothetical protein
MCYTGCCVPSSGVLIVVLGQEYGNLDDSDADDAESDVDLPGVDLGKASISMKKRSVKDKVNFKLSSPLIPSC